MCRTGQQARQPLRSRSEPALPSYGATQDTNVIDPARLGVNAQEASKHVGWVVFALGTSVLCASQGATIVANLQIEIGSYFRAGSLAPWLATGYLLGVAALTPLYGGLVAIFGRKESLLLSLGMFSAGTAGSCVAQNMTCMIIARGLAGAGGGGLMTVSAIIIADLVSVADRGYYQGMINLLYGCGSGLGSLIGGAIANVFGWRAAFWFQLIPLTMAGVLVIFKLDLDVHRKLGDERTKWEKVRQIDWAGVWVLVINVCSLTIASSLTTSSHLPIRHPIVIGLLGVVLLTAPLFVWVENRAERPVLPLGFLRDSQLSLILFGFAILTATNYSRLYILPVYFHVPRNLDAATTGLLLLPSLIIGSTSSLYSGWHMRHFKEYKWFQFFVSLTTWAQGASLVFTWDIDTDLTRLWLEAGVGAVGGGVLITSWMTTLVAAVRYTQAEEISLAISACYLFRAYGQVIGVAGAAAVEQFVLFSGLQTLPLSDASPDLVWSIINEPATAIPRLEAGQQVAARRAYLDSIRAVFSIVINGTGILFSILCLLVRAKPI